MFCDRDSGGRKMSNIDERVLKVLPPREGRDKVMREPKGWSVPPHSMFGMGWFMAERIICDNDREGDSRMGLVGGFTVTDRRWRRSITHGIQILLLDLDEGTTPSSVWDRVVHIAFIYGRF
eukprot:Gb_21438 [translate_table: standard]